MRRQPERQKMMTDKGGDSKQSLINIIGKMILPHGSHENKERFNIHLNLNSQAFWMVPAKSKR